jgi:hypothetical protein
MITHCRGEGLCIPCSTKVLERVLAEAELELEVKQLRAASAM